MLFYSTLVWFLVARLRGGSFLRLSEAELKHTEFLVLAFLTRALLQSGRLALASRVTGPLHTAAFLLLLFSIYKNLGVHGMPLAFAGTLLNTLVISANGGRMPVSGSALTKAGISPAATTALAADFIPTHTLVTEGTRLSFLGDCLWLRWPWGGGVAFSMGDVVLVLGMYFIVQHLMGVRTGRTG